MNDFYSHLQSHHPARSPPSLTDADRAGLAQLFEDFNKPKPKPAKPAVNVPHHFIPGTKNVRLCNVCLGLKRDKVHIIEKTPEEAPESPPIVNTYTIPPDRAWSSRHHFRGMSAREMDYERQRILKKHGNFKVLAMSLAIYAFCQVMPGLGLIYFTQVYTAMELAAKLWPCFKYIIPLPTSLA
jgi:hypothetical protein